MSTGWREDYWKGWPFEGKQYGGSEHIVVEVAAALAAQGHEVTVRLPRDTDERAFRGVRWIGQNAPSDSYDLLYCFDDYQRSDRGRTALVACRSDPPPHTDFDSLIFLSNHHASLMGHAGSPSVGGGVDLSAYEAPAKRIPRRVICTSSPDRCSAASLIGRGFDFVHSYKPVNGVGKELTRDELTDLQKSAKAMIYPLDPRRPSDFFSMAVLESMAAGTPVIVSDADSMTELWSDAAIVLPRPIDLGAWQETLESLFVDRTLWKSHAERGKMLAQNYSWDKVAARYLSAAGV